MFLSANDQVHQLASMRWYHQRTLRSCLYPYSPFPVLGHESLYSLPTLLKGTYKLCQEDITSIASVPIDCFYKLPSTVVRRNGEKNIGDPLVKPSDFIRESLPGCEGMNQFARKGLICADSSYLEKHKCERVSAAIGSDSLAFSVG